MFVQLKRLAGHSAVYTFGEVLRSSLNVLLLPLYTKLLTPGDYGILGVVGPVYGLLSILMGLGLQGAIMRFYFDFDGDEDRLRRYLGTVSVALLGFGLLSAVALTFFGPWLFGLLLPGTAFDPYVLLTIWNVFLSLTLIVPQALFRVRQKPTGYVLLMVGDFLVTTCLIILFVAGLKQGALGNLRAQVLAAALMAVPALWVTVSNVRPTFRWADLLPSLAFSLPLLPHMMGNWVLNVSDRVVLDGFASRGVIQTGDIGRYTLGYQFGFVLNMVGLSLNNAWVPFFYQQSRQRPDDPAIPPFITYLVLIMAGLALALALLGREVIQIMADPVFWPAYTVVPWIVAGYFLRYLYFFPAGGLFFSRQTRWVPVATLVAGALNVGLNLWLIPYFGIQAAAVNTCIGFGLLLAMIFVVGQRHYPLRYEYRRLGRILAIALGLFAAGQLAASLPLWPRTAWEVFLIACFPVFLYLSGFLSAPERRRLALLWRAAKDRAAPPGPGNPPIEPDQ